MAQTNAEAPFQRVFEADPKENSEKKCGHCRYQIFNRYILAGSEAHAEARREEMADDPNDNGICGDCLLDLLMDEDCRVTRESDDRPRAAGISLPAVGFDVNGDIPPTGEPFNHEDFRHGIDRCPVDDCEGQLSRVKVVSDDGDGGESMNHLKTIEVSCQSCQRVLYKSESVVYDGFEGEK